MGKNKIGIVLALDGEQKFAEGMRNAEERVRLAKQELKNLQEECKENANTLDALTRKETALKNVLGQYRQALKAAQSGQERANEQLGKAKEKLEALKKGQEEANTKLEECRKAEDRARKAIEGKIIVSRKEKEALRKSEKATKEAEAAASQYENAIKKQEIQIAKCETNVVKWDTKVVKANADVKAASRSVEENSRYLQEARESADGCASSIDSFGKAIQSAGEKTAESSERFSSTSGVLAELRSGFVGGIGLKFADGLAKVGDMAVEAGRKIIEAGKAAAAYADEVLTMSDITGMSTDRIQEITYAAGLMDTELSTVESSMRKNISSMRSAAKGSAEFSSAYKKLGVSVTGTDGKLRDSEEVYWDCIDALGEIEDRTERDAVAMQLFGKSAQDLNPLIAKGSKGFRELAQEAHNVGYVLDSETLGKLGKAQDSFDRLDAAGQAFGNALGSFVAPALGGLADIAAGSLNAVTSLLKGGRTETEQYVDALAKTIGTAREAIEAEKDWESSAAEQIGEFEYYRDVLKEAAEAGKLDAEQKERVSQIVEDLKERVPELTLAWDEQNGVLNLTKKEVDALVDSQEDYIRQSAFVEARTKAYKALGEAEVAQAKANASYNKSMADAGKLLGREVKSLEQLGEELDAIAINPMMAGTEKHTRLQTIEKEARTARKAADEMASSIGELREEVDLVDAAAESAGLDIPKGMGDAAKAAEETADTFGMAEDSVKGFRESAQEMKAAVAEAFEEAHGAAENAFSVNAFESWEKNAENGIQKMQEALEKQAKSMDEYSENFSIVSDNLRETSPEFLGYIQDLGKEGAQLVEELADAFRNGDTQAVKDLIGKYEETLDAQKEIADVSARNVIALKKANGEFGSTAEEWEGLEAAVLKVRNSGLPEELASELYETLSTAKAEGAKIPEGLTEAIASSDDKPAEAARACITKLTGAINAQKSAIYGMAKDTGHQVVAGVVLGLQEKYGDVVDAATGMVNVALEKARARAGIKSPSKLFRDEVGVFISAGLAEGIKSGNSLTVEAAESQMNATLAAMKSWLKKNKAGAEEIAYTWQAVATSALKNGFGISRTKTEGSGNDAKTVQKTKSEYASDILSAATSYLANLKELYDVSTRQEVDYWRSVRARLDSGTQAWITASGKIRKLQKQASQEARSERSAEEREEKQHYAERLSTMEGYVSHREAMGRMSARQERKYWQEHIEEFEKGSEQYKKISEKLVSLEARIVSERLAKYEAYVQRQTALQRMSVTREKEYWEKRISEFEKGSEEYKGIQERLATLESGIGTSGVAASVLSTYQTYYNMSEKAEAQYWNVVRKTYKAGTADRLAADQAYLAAKEKLTARLSEIESDYADKIKDVTEKYKESVAARREAIYSAFGLFDAFESNSATGGDLLFNIQSQAAGYEEWIKSLEELQGRGIFSDRLMEELTDKGPADIAAVKALLTLTDDQMRLYQEAYDKKLELSDKQAKAENAELKKETKEEIKALKADMAAAMADANEPITDGLKAVATKIESVAEDQTAAIVAAFAKGDSKLKGSVGSSVSKATRDAAGLSSYQTNGLMKKDADVRAQAEADRARDEERKKAEAEAARKEEEAAAEQRRKEAEEEAKKAEKIKALDAIKSAKKLNAPLTAEQRKRHAQIYTYLADKYGIAGSSGLYARLAAIFGLPEYGGTGAERTKILQELKAHGLRKGTLSAGSGAAWMDEDLEKVGPEIIIRKSDKAILTRLESGDAVVPANLAKNLFAWGAISPTDLNLASMASLNEKLAQAYHSHAKASNESISALQRIIEILGDYLPHISDGHEIRMDTGALVGALAGGISREVAKRSRRAVR